MILKRLHLLPIALFILGSTQLFAQEVDQSLKWQQKDWGTAFNVNGLIQNINLTAPESAINQPYLFAKQAVKSDLMLRYGFGVINYNNGFNSTDSIGLAEVIADSSYKQANFFFSLGAEKHFAGTRRLDPYVGLELVLGIVGRENINTVETFRDTTGVARLNTVEEYAGGTSFGANIILGTNYFVAERLSLGAEFMYGFTSMSTGGDFSKVTIFEPVAGTGTTTREIGSQRSTANGLSMNSQVSITLSYFFDLNAKK